MNCQNLKEKRNNLENIFKEYLKVYEEAQENGEKKILDKLISLKKQANEILKQIQEEFPLGETDYTNLEKSETEDLKEKLGFENSWINSTQTLESGNILFVGDYGKACIYNPKTNEIVTSVEDLKNILKFGNSWINSTQTLESGNILFAGEYGKACIYNPKTNEIVVSAKELKDMLNFGDSWIRSTQILKNGNILFAGQNGKAKILKFGKEIIEV